jgi:hypothetical protein
VPVVVILDGVGSRGFLERMGHSGLAVGFGDLSVASGATLLAG